VKREGHSRLPVPLQSRRNGSGEARRLSAEAGTYRKPLQRHPGPKKRLRRSAMTIRGSRHLSKAAETAPEKREDYPRKPATLKSRRNGSGEARRLSAEAGNSQKPPKRLLRSAKTIRGSRQLSKAAETAPEQREGYPRLPAPLQKPPKRLRRSAKTIRGSRQLSKAASFPAAPWRSVPQPALLPALPPGHPG